jgi:protein SCO1
MIRALLALLAFLFVGPAQAALTPAELDGVALAPSPGAMLSGDARFTDQNGTAVRLGDLLGLRPLLLVLADYECREICGPILAVIGATLGKTGLVAGRDYDLVALGLNPRATATDARRMGAAQLGALADRASLLSGSADTVASVERALGYRAVYDTEAQRYAHPADVLVLAPDGQVSRVLPGLSLDSAALRLALVEAGQGRIGTLGDRLRLLCYGLAPAHGVANRAVGVALAAGGALTLGGLGLFVTGLARRGRQSTALATSSSRGGAAGPGTGVLRLFPLRSARREGAAGGSPPASRA